MTFLHPLVLLLLPLAFTPFWLKGSQGQMYSWLSIAPDDKLSDIANLVLKIMVTLILASIILAIASPQGPDIKMQRVGKGAQTVMVIDRSVSMEHTFAGDSTSGRVAEIKSAAANRLITKFIDSRPNDMMGVVAFTNSALYGIKITTNRDAIHAGIDAATSSGINQTNLGAGITEAIAMFDRIQSSGFRAIILLSDGAGKISPRVKAKIKEGLTKRGLNLYWIVLREPDDISIFSNTTYAEGTEPPAVELDRLFKSINIKYRAYEADNPTSLQSAIQDIDSREKNVIKYWVSIPGHDYTRDLILVAMVLSLFIILLKNLRVHSWEPA